MAKYKLKDFLNLFKKAWQIFVENHPIKFASSFAYFSLFGLPSILLIIVFILSFMFDKADLFEELRQQVASVLGTDGANILVLITQNYGEQTVQNTFTIIGYTITVYLLATQLIIFFQDILNNLWQIKPDFKNLWQKQWKERGLATLIVLLTGLLFFVSVAIERALLFFSVNFFGQEGELTGAMEIVINMLTGLIVYIWFALLYKMLPFVHIKWEPTLIGAAVTTVLFFIGTWLLWEFVVVEQSLEDIYDFVAPVVLISFWIFYISLAFLFGASLTKAYAELTGKPIDPTSYAYKFKIVDEDGNPR